MDSKIEVCKTCNGTGIEYEGAGHTCTACNGIAAPVVERKPVGAGEAIRAMAPKDWELIAANATCSQQATLISMQNTELSKLRQLIDPVGYKLVPITPTLEMVQAGIDTLCGNDEHQDYRDVYAAMIGAAP